MQEIRRATIGPCHKVHQGNELGKITKQNGRVGNNVVPNNDTLSNTRHDTYIRLVMPAVAVTICRGNIRDGEEDILNVGFD